MSSHLKSKGGWQTLDVGCACVLSWKALALRVSFSAWRESLPGGLCVYCLPTWSVLPAASGGSFSVFLPRIFQIYSEIAICHPKALQKWLYWACLLRTFLLCWAIFDLFCYQVSFPPLTFFPDPQRNLALWPWHQLTEENQHWVVAFEMWTRNKASFLVLEPNNLTCGTKPISTSSLSGNFSFSQTVVMGTQNVLSARNCPLFLCTSLCYWCTDFANENNNDDHVSPWFAICGYH